MAVVNVEGFLGSLFIPTYVLLGTVVMLVLMRIAPVRKALLMESDPPEYWLGALAFVWPALLVFALGLLMIWLWGYALKGWGPWLK